MYRRDERRRDVDRDRKLEDWYETYSKDVFNFLVYYNRSHDVDDLVQEVFIKAWRKEFSFRHTSSPKTWLLSIARRVSIDQFRKERLKSWLNINDEMKDTDQTPEEKLLNKEEDIQLYNTINELKRTYREVIFCKGIFELSTKETAEVLQWSPEKVDTTYYRAKLKLGDLLERKREGRNYAET